MAAILSLSSYTMAGRSSKTYPDGGFPEKSIIRFLTDFVWARENLRWLPQIPPLCAIFTDWPMFSVLSQTVSGMAPEMYDCATKAMPRCWKQLTQEMPPGPPRQTGPGIRWSWRG